MPASTSPGEQEAIDQPFARERAVQQHAVARAKLAHDPRLAMVAAFEAEGGQYRHQRQRQQESLRAREDDGERD